MQIEYREVLQTIPDNDVKYFSLLEGVINSSDELAIMEIRKHPTAYNFRIAPSSPNYIQPLIKALNALHTLLGITMEYSKSMKNSSSINFNISLTLSN